MFFKTKIPEPKQLEIHKWNEFLIKINVKITLKNGKIIKYSQTGKIVETEELVDVGPDYEKRIELKEILGKETYNKKYFIKKPIKYVDHNLINLNFKQELVYIINVDDLNQKSISSDEILSIDVKKEKIKEIECFIFKTI